MYVVKIIIHKGESNVLYSISTKSNGYFAYMKSQCCNYSLTVEEIEFEINKWFHMKNIHTNIYNNDTLDDPLPEMTYDDNYYHPSKANYVI